MFGGTDYRSLPADLTLRILEGGERKKIYNYYLLERNVPSLLTRIFHVSIHALKTTTGKRFPGPQQHLIDSRTSGEQSLNKVLYCSAGKLIFNTNQCVNNNSVTQL